MAWITEFPDLEDAQERARKAMAMPIGARIIEVGSGAGWTTEILVALGYRVVCLEPAQGMIDVARERVASFLQARNMSELQANVEWHCCALEEYTAGQPKTLRTS